LVNNFHRYDTDNWVSTPNLRPNGWKPTKTLEQSITEMVEAYERTA
jgi:hypothetical protein